MKKALMRIWSYALVVLAGGLIITSCAKDRDEDNAEQSYIKLDKSSVDLTQLGETFELAAKPKVIVSSNVYWVIELVNVTNPSEDVEWIDLGGVSA